MDETNQIRLATGRYMNFFTDNGRYDIFIIINEANDINDKTSKEAEELFNIVDDALGEKIDKMTAEEIEEYLEPLFECGVQVIINKK